MGRNEVTEALVLVFQVSITMIVPIVLCTLAGAWVDNHYGTKWAAIIGFFLGAVAGGQNVYRLVKKFLK